MTESCLTSAGRRRAAGSESPEVVEPGLDDLGDRSLEGESVLDVEADLGLQAGLRQLVAKQLGQQRRRLILVGAAPERQLMREQPACKLRGRSGRGVRPVQRREQ